MIKPAQAAACAAALAAACAALAACSYNSEASGPTTSAPVTSQSTEPSSSSAPVTTSPPPTTTSAAPSTSASTTTPAAPHNTCAKGALTVRLLPGGAVRGHEIAAVSVTNDSDESCVVWGFPQVQLELKGAPLGSPAVPHGTPKDVALPKGAEAQALITDDSTCNAPLSDTLTVTLPESTVTATRPMQLRGCALQIDPFTPAE